MERRLLVRVRVALVAAILCASCMLWLVIDHAREYGSPAVGASQSAPGQANPSVWTVISQSAQAIEDFFFPPKTTVIYPTMYSPDPTYRYEIYVNGSCPELPGRNCVETDDPNPYGQTLYGDEVLPQFPLHTDQKGTPPSGH